MQRINQPARPSADAARIGVMLFLALLWLSPVRVRASDPAQLELEHRFTNTVRPFLETYCITCYGPLDNTCLLYLSNMWSGSSHDNTKLPVLTVGGLGGTLKTGRVLDYAEAGDQNRKLCSLHLSLMDRLGVSLPRFGDSYPVLDLVVCHGDFLNADHEYVHKNKNVKGFGSYGDIMIRDRKMYVAPTPFGLTTGTAHNQTLILPADFRVDSRFRAVGKLVRREAQTLIVGYTFNLRTNTLKPESVENPAAGTEHNFAAHRLKGSPTEAVAMRPPREVITEVAEAAKEDE